MFGVVIRDLGVLRKDDFRFLESKTGDFMKIKKNNYTIRTIKLNDKGNIEVRDNMGYLLAEVKSVEILIQMLFGTDVIWMIYHNDDQ